MSSSAPAPEETRLISEETDVFRWRVEQFRQLGFNDADACDLAGSEADLGRARHLQRKRLSAAPSAPDFGVVRSGSTWRRATEQVDLARSCCRLFWNSVSFLELAPDDGVRFQQVVIYGRQRS
jgi:hypothetical protein